MKWAFVVELFYKIKLLKRMSEGWTIQDTERDLHQYNAFTCSALLNTIKLLYCLQIRIPNLDAIFSTLFYAFHY